MTGLLLDSVILIDHFNGVTAATDYLRRNWTSASVSVITRAEVLTGFQAHREALAKQLLDRFPTLPAGADDADLAAAFRRQYRWKLPDALQAAIAVNRRLHLVTRNTRDFDPAHHAFVLIPYTVT
ncbi:MAG: PIN domain-containing protein [Gammaproteobacteria bacterium]